MVFYKKGAEAELFQIKFEGKKALLKKRILKKYRNKKLDESIRKKRTRSEAKLLREAGKIINTPHIYQVNEDNAEIVMEFIEGQKLKEIIENKKNLAELAGKEIKKIHNYGLIHGDLTTSNIIHNKGVLFFVDFGLGYFSKKIEDQATDLVVFKKTFNATHSSFKNGWKKVMNGYKPSKEIVTKMEAIEKRARYH
jgi:Kae1-associated kinase Bud32